MSFRKKSGNLGFIVIIIFFALAFVLVSTPGLTFDSFVYFFSQSPVSILGDPMTVMGIFFGLFLLFLLLAGNQGRKM
ncbi:MAG: hypothetical protein ACXACY_30410 [Candidatus Hodarchaeales archaeon]|jgi:hypothetical protein